MRIINKLLRTLFATLVASAVAVANQPRDESSNPVIGTEKTQGCVVVNGLKMYYEIHGTIKAPILIALGDRDGVSPEHAVEVVRIIPNAQIANYGN